MSEIQKFDMAAVQQRIADSIKAQFAMLIPDEAFDQMTMTAITEFFNTEKNFEFKEIKRPNPNGSWHSDVHVRFVLEQALTPFKAMIWDEVHKIVTAKIKVWIDGEKENVGAQIQAMFGESEDLKALFVLDVNKLAMQMARDAHAHLLKAAADQAGMNMSMLAGQVDYLGKRLDANNIR